MTSTHPSAPPTGNGGQWEPIEVEALEEVIGLSYDNFKRTIIIPQGQFQEFLQLGNKDRTKMMKELFNLEKFEFYYKVVSLEKRTTKNDSTSRGSCNSWARCTLHRLPPAVNR